MIANNDLKDVINYRTVEVERAHQRDWVLTPLNGKKPLLRGWTKLPRPTLEQVREWAQTGNVGLRTGNASGVFVIDFDPSKGGDYVSLKLPRTPTVFTGGGGQHFYFVAPEEPLGNSASKLGPGIDTRGDGGQVVFPGSIHPVSGGVYRWASGLSPEDIPLATLPHEILTLIRPSSKTLRTDQTRDLVLPNRYAAAALQRETKKVRTASEKTRNNTLNTAAFALGQLIPGGLLDEQAVTDALLMAAQDAGLSEREALATICSGVTAGAKSPRRLMQASCDPASSSGKTLNVVKFEKAQLRTKSEGGGSSDHGEGALPKIDAGDGSLPRMARGAWNALRDANNPPRWFRYGGIPSRIQRDDTKIVIVRELNNDRMRYLLARVATWTRLTREGLVEVHPPMAVIKDMLACPGPPLPILTRIVEAPIFASDGTLCTKPGYNAASQTFYAPAMGFTVSPVSATPTSAEIDRARALVLDELLTDFPFTGPAERSNAVALALLPFVRELIDGATPLHLFEKPSPGTGGTLLVEVLLFPALGHAVATMTEGTQEEEWRKRLTAKLIQGPTAILIDNIRNPLESSAVAAAITSPTWEDRILGVSQIARVPVRCAWAATGNNPIVSNEMARRAIRIRLDAMMDQPWLRQDFKHPKLLMWTREHRADLVWALLTLAQSWLSAGSPQPSQAKSLGMFEEWARVIGGILAHAGIEGFLGNLEDFYTDTDSEGTALRSFVTVWFEKFHDQLVGVSDLLPLVNENDLFDLGDDSDRSRRTRLGKLIGKQRDRLFGTHRIVAAGEQGGSRRWRLETVSSV